MGALSGVAARMVGELGEIGKSWGNDGKVHENGKVQVLLFPEANSKQDRKREITGIYQKICTVTQGYDKLSFGDKQAVAQQLKMIGTNLKRWDSVEKQESPEVVREITNKIFEFAGGLEAKAANRQESPSPPKVDNAAYLAQRAENLDAKTLQYFRDNAKENDYFFYKTSQGGYGLYFKHQGILRNESVSVNKNGHLEIEGRTYQNFDKWRFEKEKVKVSGRLGFRVEMKFKEEKELVKAPEEERVVSRSEMVKLRAMTKSLNEASIGKLTDSERKPFEEYVATHKNANQYLIFENKEFEFGILYPKDGKLVQANLDVSAKGIELGGKTYKDFEELRTSLKLEGPFKRMIPRSGMAKLSEMIRPLNEASIGKLTDGERKPFEEYVATHKNANQYLIFENKEFEFGILYPKDGKLVRANLDVSAKGIELGGKTYKDFEELRTSLKLEGPFKRMISRSGMAKLSEMIRPLNEASIGKLTDGERKPFEQYVAQHKNDNHYLIFENKEFEFSILYPKDGKLVQANLGVSAKGIELGGKTYEDFEELRTSLKLSSPFKK